MPVTSQSVPWVLGKFKRCRKMTSAVVGVLSLFLVQALNNSKLILEVWNRST